MHLKMDTWQSEWVNESNINTELSNPFDSIPYNSTLYSLDFTADSTSFSRDDSVESGGEEISDKNDTSILKPTFKSVLQAKKRLQAFSASKQLKRTGSKDEKTEDGDKSSPKKSKKAVYPDDKAKSVIQEIEEIKKYEAKVAREEQLKQEAIIQTALRSMMRHRSKSLSPEREKHFKRREIKRRNYRRSDSFNRKSASPEDHSRRSDRSSPRKLAYPKNWAQYKQLNLTVVKDEELKLKILPKQKYSQHELVFRLFNFSTPSPLTESFKYFSVEEKHENVPASFIRVTRSKPPLTYSINSKKNKESFITKNQLFQIISKDRRNIIENLINTPSRCQPNEKPLQSRHWYSKSWKKTSDAECKVLENSVGLSFLQTYSDEEEDIETEEIVICSSTKETASKKTICPNVVIGSSTKDSGVKEIVRPKDTIPSVDVFDIKKPQLNEIERDISMHTNVVLEQMLEKQVEEREKKESLRQEKSEEIKRHQQHELKQTRKAIRELEEELERRKAIQTEEDAKERRKVKKKRKRKVKKKQDLSDEEEEEEEEEIPKRKKKKNKSKKKKYIEEESYSSEDEKRKKKKNKKTGKRRKEKSRKKKEKSKKEEALAKEHKIKKKDENSEENNLEEAKRKKKKSNNDDSSYLDEKNSVEEPKTKNKKKSKKKKEKGVNKDNEKQSVNKAEILTKEDKKKRNEENEEEYVKETVENSGKKRRRKDRRGSGESENVIEQAFQFYEFETSERGSLSKSKDYEEIEQKSEPKQSTSKVDDKNRNTSREKSSKFEKESKRFNEEQVSKTKDRESVTSERESKKSKDNSEKPHKLEESSKKKNEAEEAKVKEIKNSETIEDGSNKKHIERAQQREDSERKRKYSEKSEKHDADGKSSRDRRNSEVLEQAERNHSKDRIKDKHHKEKRHKEEHLQPSQKVVVKQEPDWENLRSKRKRHRNSDSKEPSKDLLESLDLPDDLETFPLEKEIFRPKEKHRNEIPNKRSRRDYRRETGTPDTDEYRENWEKDVFPIWESEDEAPPKPREKLNNSWESDEEVFERGQSAAESSRPINTTFDLEIPLNIKPFKRREVIDPDTELQLLKREGQTLSEERRRLEIEKLRVKELELKVIKEVESKTKEQYKSKVIKNVENKVKEGHKPKVTREVESKPKENQSKPKIVKEVVPKVVREVESMKEDQLKPKVVKEIEYKMKQDQLKPDARDVQSKLTEDKPSAVTVVENKVQEDQQKPPNKIGINEEKVGRSLEQVKGEVKRGRWDKKVAQPRMSTPKVDAINVDKIKKEIPDEDDSLTNVSSTTSLNNSVTVLENEYEEFMKAVSSGTVRKKKSKTSREEFSSIDSSSFESSDSESSSSKHSEAKKIPRNDKDMGGKNFVFKNIITNLDELNLPPLDSPSKQSSVIILPQDIPLIPMPLPQTELKALPNIEIKPVPVPSPSIDIDKIPKPLFNLGLSASITLDIASKFVTSGVDSPSGKSLEFINPAPAATSSIQSPKVQKVEEIVSSRKSDCLINFASPLTDVSLDSVLFEEKLTENDDTRLNDKPFVFTSMVLPSKRPLLNNSNLNFADSEDEETNAAKSMRKLEEIIKENLTDSAKVSEDKEKVEVRVEKAKEVDVFREETNIPSIENRDKHRSRSPASNRTDLRRRSNEKAVRRDISPKRTSSARREPSPRRRIREPSPKRRGPSPRRNVSPRKRTPPRRRNSPVKRKYSPIRSTSPRFRRRSSISPPRKLSPRRSISPRGLPKRRSKSPEKSKSALPPYKTIERLVTDSNRRKSPITITSPLEGLKRSVADSTISDDLLPQPSANLEEYVESPVSRFYDRTAKPVESPRRLPLDIRISQVLGLGKDEPKPITTTYSSYSYEQAQYRQQFSQPPEQKSNIAPIQKVKVAVKQTKGSFVQVGNMVQIVPTQDIPIIEPSKIPVPPLPSVPPREKPVAVHKKEKKSQILQVGNMLQIVPADMLPEVPLPPEPKPPKPKPLKLKLPEPKLPEPKIEVAEPIPETSMVVQEKQSAEEAMRLKVAERRAERDKRRQERERRRKEKEKRRKEKEKQRQIKLKQRTENMIKKALQLEVEGGEEDEESALNETPAQWPPLPIIVSSVSKDVGKSILIRGGQSKSNVLRSDKTKVVQFADGVRPGEGTSPSGGEELSSPPPVSKKLPKEKRYKKTKLLKKNPKKKVKVKIIKKRPEKEESDEEDNLPPPSPPPGSPPPHLFPPRIKPQPINNVHTYIPNVVPIQASHNQQLYRPQLNLIMQPPHPPHHHGPPPPTHHHGPPPPHHGPPPLPHLGPPHHVPPPLHHHHGPPPPPGPPHFHHGPPLPPGPPHHHGPTLPHGTPGPHL